MLFSSWIAFSMHLQCFVWNFWVNGFPSLWLFYHVNLDGLYMRKGFLHWHWVLLVSNIMFTANKIFRQDFGFRIRFWRLSVLSCFKVLFSPWIAFSMHLQCLYETSGWMVSHHYNYSTMLILVVYTWERGFGIEIDCY